MTKASTGKSSTRPRSPAKPRQLAKPRAKKTTRSKTPSKIDKIKFKLFSARTSNKVNAKREHASWIMEKRMKRKAENAKKREDQFKKRKEKARMKKEKAYKDQLQARNSLDRAGYDDGVIGVKSKKEYRDYIKENKKKRKDVIHKEEDMKHVVTHEGKVKTDKEIKDYLKKNPHKSYNMVVDKPDGIEPY